MRDENKHRLDVAVPRDSETFRSLCRDASLHHMSDQLGKMATIRLADYYMLAEKLGTYSVEGILAALAIVPSREASVCNNLPEEECSITAASALEHNVDEAADVWGSM